MPKFRVTAAAQNHIRTSLRAIHCEQEHECISVVASLIKPTVPQRREEALRLGPRVGGWFQYKFISRISSIAEPAQSLAMWCVFS